MKQVMLFTTLLILVLITGMSLWWQQRDSARVDGEQLPIATGANETVSIEPVHIRIPKLEIELEVKQATVSGNEWTIYEDAASWLVSSGGLNAGNMVIYAHNKREMFEEVRQLVRGDDIIVTSQDRKGRFRVSRAFETNARDIEYVTEPVNRLTLYTCSGPLDSRRYFVLAELVEISSI